MENLLNNTEKYLNKTKQNPLKTNMRKLYLKGLGFAVEVGAVSWLSLSKKVGVDCQTAKEMLSWMIEQGYVKDEFKQDELKTTVMTQVEFDNLLQEEKCSLKSKREKQRTVSDSLYKACLRLAIRQGYVGEGLFKRAFAIGKVRAQAVIDKMNDDGYIFFNMEALRLQPNITKEQFKELYGEEV